MIDRRVIILSGAGGGLGKAITTRLVRDGMYVVMCSSRLEKGVGAWNQLPEDVRENSLPLGCKVDRMEDIREMIETVLEKTGRIDGLINGAGMHSKKTMEEITPEHLEKCLGSVLKGALLMTRELVPYMKQSTLPTVVHLTTAGARAGAIDGLASDAAKGGLISMTRSMAKELAPLKIRVNAAAIGYLEDDIADDDDEERNRRIAVEIPLKRLGKAEEIAPVIAMLSSYGASYMTGAVVDVSGGYSMG